MTLNDLKQKHKLIDLFIKLCEIPSPSLKEQVVTEEILKIFNNNNISANCDEYGNIIAKFSGNTDVEALLLSAHMDVVGGTDAVNISLSSDGKYIETDKTRTLGADNKAGIAAILDLAIDLANSNNNIQHGPIEISFTRDEEKGMTGINNLDTNQLQAKYAIIADGEHLGELDTEGAGFTNVYIRVQDGKGGHSGINIHEKERISAVKVLSEIDAQIPQGAYKYDDKKGTITSINAGVAIGGAADTYISELLKEAYELGKDNQEPLESYSAKNIMDMVNHNTALNIIGSNARIAYSVRSSEPDNEQELLNHIRQVVDDTNKKYNGLIKVELEIQYHLKPFVRNEDEALAQVITQAAEATNIDCTPGCFHAGAETHILANDKENANGEAFNPVLLGIADIYDMHSPNERIDWQSFLKGRKWLEEIVVRFAKK